MVQSQWPPNTQFQDARNVVVNDDENVCKSSYVQDPHLIMIICSPPRPSRALPRVNALAKNRNTAPRGRRPKPTSHLWLSKPRRSRFNSRPVHNFRTPKMSLSTAVNLILQRETISISQSLIFKTVWHGSFCH